ncbi:MAG: GspE/PulE family protein [Gammaproteobacteria bacterium]|jgi:MSHA biogenesis protein MshE|nr:GspE/PulE family protein [Gammaproteobacteria bacterium]
MAENSKKRIRIGDLLIEQGTITAQQLETALAEQRASGLKLGRVLIALGFVKESDILDILSSQLNIPYINLSYYKFSPDLVRRLPETLARRYRCIVLAEENGELVIGMADPTDIFAYDAIAKYLNTNIKQAVISETGLIRTFDLVYRRTAEIHSFAQELGNELSDSDTSLEAMAAGENLTDAPVVKLLQSLFEDAIQVGSSDIHIEPDEKVLRIRQRIDGVLHEQVMDQKRIANALVMRLKIISGIDISEKRMPQDGRFNIRVKGHSIDVRLSTMPVQHGESVVMRLLDQSSGILELEHLGMPAAMIKAFRRAIHTPHGLVLVTGATGSGKTTTLYAALKELNTADKKIITAEDPVEYRLPRISQVQVHTKIDLNFAQILRAALRQDPDIILVGEMRDQKTVEIAIRAAMTGHLVLSTLHTNDAMHTLERLLDLGVEGYLIATALRAVVAQRLLRRVCESCKRKVTLDNQQVAWLKTIVNGQYQNGTFYKGVGCAHCNNTGYHGRIGIYEMIEPDETMLEAIRINDVQKFNKAVSENKNHVPLLESGLDLAAKGVTSLSEVMSFSSEYFQEEPEIADSYNVDDL